MVPSLKYQSSIKVNMYFDLQDLMQAPRSWQKLPSRKDEYTIPRNEERSMVRSKTATRTLPHAFSVWSRVESMTRLSVHYLSEANANSIRHRGISIESTSNKLSCQPHWQSGACNLPLIKPSHAISHEPTFHSCPMTQHSATARQDFIGGSYVSSSRGLQSLPRGISTGNALLQGQV